MQMMEWLDSTPVSEACDVDFLTSEVLRLHKVYHSMHSQRQQLLELSADATNVSGGQGAGASPWRGNVPYMRFIMCLAEDDVKLLFLARTNTLSRAELDARYRSDLLRIISNWETSCQCDGGRENKYNEDAAVDDKDGLSLSLMLSSSVNIDEMPPAAIGGNLRN